MMSLHAVAVDTVTAHGETRQLVSLQQDSPVSLFILVQQTPGREMSAITTGHCVGWQVETTDHEMIPRQVGVSGAVRESAGYR